MGHQRRHAGFWAALVIPALTVGACGESTNDRVRAAQLSEGCLLNSDCAAPMVCAFRRCHTECTSSRDCPEGARCVASDRPFLVCQLEDEKLCTRNSDCPERMICGVDGECRDECESDRDCISDQACVNRTCADEAELVDGELPVDPAVVGNSSESRPCLYTSECPDPLVCRRGTCVPECRDDRDCPRGMACTEGACIGAGAGGSAGAAPINPGGAAGSSGVGGGGSSGAGGATADAGGPECVFNSDCASLRICVAGECRCECREARDCGRSEICDGCGCVPAPVDASAGCTFNSDCPAPQLCDRGQCRCACREDRDCGAGNRCDGCACQPAVPDGAPPAFGSECNLPSDCPSPLVCTTAGRCAYECVTQPDCGLGLCCFENQCVSGPICDVLDPPDPPAPVDSGADSSAPDAGGPVCSPCLANVDCTDGLWCNGEERCVGACCVPALDTPCDSNSACIEDRCDEATRSCQHINLAVTDGDDDGMLALACGGDDCDDSDPTTFLGAPELCDGVDNDCNGLIDDRAIAPLGQTFQGKQDGSVAACVSSGVVVPWGADGFRSFYRVGGCTTRFIWTEEYDASGALLGTAKTVTDARFGDVWGVTESAAGPGTAGFVTSSNTPTHWAVWVVDGSANLTGASLLSTNAGLAPSIVRAATDFVVGWGDAIDATRANGFVARVAQDGSLTSTVQVPTVDGTGNVPLNNSRRVLVATIGADVAAAYLANGGVTLTLLGSSGNVTAGPMILSTTGDLFAMTSTATYFVILHSDDADLLQATQVALDGTVVRSRRVTLPANPVLGDAADGASAPEGALFAVTNAAHQPQLVHVPDDPSRAVDLTSAMVVSNRTGPTNLNAVGARNVYSLQEAASQTFRWRTVGCR